MGISEISEVGEAQRSRLTSTKQMPMKATTPKAKGSAPGGGGWRPLGCCWKRGIDGDGDGGGGERRFGAESAEVTSDIARRVGGGPRPEALGEVGSGWGATADGVAGGDGEERGRWLGVRCAPLPWRLFGSSQVSQI